MVAQFPVESSNSSAVDSFLIPKLDIFVNMEDILITEVIYDANNLIIDNIPRSSRVVELRINAKGIEIALIKPAIKRIFTYVTHAVINDINITPADKAYLP